MSCATCNVGERTVRIKAGGKRTLLVLTSCSIDLDRSTGFGRCQESGGMAGSNDRALSDTATRWREAGIVVTVRELFSSICVDSQRINTLCSFILPTLSVMTWAVLIVSGLIPFVLSYCRRCR